MVIECPHATYYFLQMAMFALSVTVCEIFTVETWMTLTLTVRRAKVKCKYANTFYLLPIAKVCHIRYRLRDIINRNVLDRDPNLWNGPRSIANKRIERIHATLCFGNSNVCRICHHLRDNHVSTSQGIEFEF